MLFLCPVVASKFMHKMKEYETAEIHSRVQEIRGSEKNNFMQPSQKHCDQIPYNLTFGWFLHHFLIYFWLFCVTYAECKFQRIVGWIHCTLYTQTRITAINCLRIFSVFDSNISWLNKVLSIISKRL